jgi:hypothetical protein
MLFEKLRVKGGFGGLFECLLEPPELKLLQLFGSHGLNFFFPELARHDSTP